MRLLAPLMPYIAGALLATALGLGAYVWRLEGRVATLSATTTVLKLKADGCAGRIENIKTDKESDRAIDAIPDNDLRTVPDHWLRGFPSADQG